jgi:hypothetical protein
MVTKSVSQAKSRSTKLLFGLLGVLGLVALGLGAFLGAFHVLGQGTYHNTTALADLDGDGDLDLIVAGTR